MRHNDGLAEGWLVVLSAAAVSVATGADLEIKRTIHLET
jgi:hypothetical protein